MGPWDIILFRGSINTQSSRFHSLRFMASIIEQSFHYLCFLSFFPHDSLFHFFHPFLVVSVLRLGIIDHQMYKTQDKTSYNEKQNSKILIVFRILVVDNRYAKLVDNIGWSIIHELRYCVVQCAELPISMFLILMS